LSDQVGVESRVNLQLIGKLRSSSTSAQVCFQNTTVRRVKKSSKQKLNWDFQLSAYSMFNNEKEVLDSAW